MGIDVTVAFLFANALLAIVLRVFSINIFGRNLTGFEFAASATLIVLVPNFGLVWIALDLTDAKFAMNLRGMLESAIWISAIFAIVSWHAVVGYLFDRKGQ